MNISKRAIAECAILKLKWVDCHMTKRCNRYDFPATEASLFQKKKSLDELLIIARKKVAKIDKVSIIDQKIKDVNESGKIINDSLRNMSKTARERASGRISQADLIQSIRFEVSTIRVPLHTVYMKLGNMVEDKNAITSDEIRVFQNYLRGLKKILIERKEELRSTAKAMLESVTSLKEDLFTMIENDTFELDDILESDVETEDFFDEVLESAESEDDDDLFSIIEGKCCESDDEECDEDECEDKDDDDDDEEEDDDEDDEDEDDDAEEACESDLIDFADVSESLIDDDIEE